MPRQYQGPNRKTPWEEWLDGVVADAASGRLAEALAELKRFRRRDRGELIKHQWHDAEALWLEAVVLEHARDAEQAAAVWQRLARVYSRIAPREDYFLPICGYCADRQLGFAPNWYSVATRLRENAADVAATIALFRHYALGEPASLHRQPTNETNETVVTIPPATGAATVSAAMLRAKRENIRMALRELNQPAVVAHLSEEFVKLNPLDGPVWYWYGHSLIDLGRFDEAAAALQTARGLVTTDELRAMVLTAQGELALHQGHLAAAEARFREATEFEGCGDWPWIELGRLHFRLGALADAERYFRAAVDAHGTHPATALYELGLILRAQSSLFEARRILKQALVLSSHVDVYEALADVERLIRLRSRSGRTPKPPSPD